MSGRCGLGVEGSMACQPKAKASNALTLRSPIHKVKARPPSRINLRDMLFKEDMPIELISMFFINCLIAIHSAPPASAMLASLHNGGGGIHAIY